MAAPLGLRLVVDELQVRHRRGVPGARAQLHDAGVAARPLGEPRADLMEQVVDGVLRAQERDRVALGGHIGRVLAREGDQLLGDGPKLLRLGLGRLDPAMGEEGAAHVRVERLSVGRIPAQLAALALVPHSAPRRFRPCAWSVSFTSSIDFLPKFGIAASSASVLEMRSPIVSMPTRFRQLYERTPSSSSSIRMFSIPWADGAAASAAAPSCRIARSAASMSVKIDRYLIRISAASFIASLGDMEPSVVTSIRSLSKSVRWPTR